MSADHTPVAIIEGDHVPDVALVDHHGRTWRFSDQRGTTLVLILHRHLA
jgi:peroxiredoxin